MNGLVLNGIRSGYGSVRVLDGVSLSVASDEVVAVLGPNGSGKSTLVKTVMNLTTLYEGTILWNNRDITRLPAWRRAAEGLAYVPQMENVFLKLGVEEQLELGALGLSRSARREQVELVFNFFPSLARSRKVQARNLSGGERRMLAIGASLMKQPRLLILDEPTSDLAPKAIDLLFDRIEAVRRELRLPFLLVEQNVGKALEMANRVCVLIRGKVKIDQAAETLTSDDLGQVFMEHR